jgi:hypothetical protein
MRLPEFIQPFAIEEEDVTHINPSTDRGGILELYVGRGDSVFLFKGRRTRDEAKASLVLGDVDFELSASIGSPARMRIGAGYGEFTLYGFDDTLGHVRFTGCTCEG